MGLEPAAQPGLAVPGDDQHADRPQGYFANASSLNFIGQYEQGLAENLNGTAQLGGTAVPRRRRRRAGLQPGRGAAQGRPVLRRARWRPRHAGRPALRRRPTIARRRRATRWARRSPERRRIASIWCRADSRSSPRRRRSTCRARPTRARPSWSSCTASTTRRSSRARAARPSAARSIPRRDSASNPAATT